MYSTAHHESEIEKMEASDEIVWRQSYASFQELLQPQRDYALIVSQKVFCSTVLTYKKGDNL